MEQLTDHDISRIRLAIISKIHALYREIHKINESNNRIYSETLDSVLDDNFREVREFEALLIKLMGG